MYPFVRIATLVLCFDRLTFTLCKKNRSLLLSGWFCLLQEESERGTSKSPSVSGSQGGRDGKCGFIGIRLLFL